MVKLKFFNTVIKINEIISPFEKRISKQSTNFISRGNRETENILDMDGDILLDMDGNPITDY